MLLKEQVSHDIFNLGALAYLNFINIFNWSIDIDNYKFVWTGDFFEITRVSFMIYFLVDIIWIYIYPNSVKSPRIIYSHHFLSLIGLQVMPLQIYILASRLLFIEINTWFLILRRLLYYRYSQKINYLNYPINIFNINIKPISILFYLSWIWYRLIVMPQLFYSLIIILLDNFSISNLSICIIHGVLTGMSIKWTRDLLYTRYIKSKISNGL